MEKDSVIISVIIPVYNTASYLDFALHNIIEQQFGNLADNQWEVIVVDDGSTDNSLLQAESWCQKYRESVRVISTPNRGVSAARNTGLSVARGRYVYFADSDDILLGMSLPTLCNEADKCGAEVIKFVFRDIDSNAYTRLKTCVPQANLESLDFHFISTTADYLRATNGLAGPPSHHATWSTIYNKKFLDNNSLKFNESLQIGEDIIMTWRAMLCKPRVLYADRALYLYHHRSGSAINKQKTVDFRRQSEAYLRYLHELTEVAQRANTIFGEDVVGKGMADNIRYASNRALELLVLAGTSFREIYRAMRNIRANGGNIHPGRPRFSKPVRRQAPRSAKMRRWLAAYIIAPIACIG